MRIIKVFSRIKGFLFTTIIIFLCSVSIGTSAQSVVVEGNGENKEAAVRDAMRNSVEQVVGTFIDSHTIVSQYSIIQDEIYSKAQGFVRGITILSEENNGNMYCIRAKIDVDTDPKSELSDRISMIMLLNDPRISVIVNYYVDNPLRDKYSLICEAAMNNKLKEVGFSHIVSSNNILKNKNIDKNTVNLTEMLLPNNELDYLVIGKLDIHTDKITLPKYAEYSSEIYGGDVNTRLLKTVVEMDVNVYKANTGELVGSFRNEAQAIKNTTASAELQGVKDSGIKAADQLRKTLANHAANVNQGLQLIVRADSYDIVQEVGKAIENLAGIRNVNIKGFAGGKATIYIETDLKPQSIFRQLKAQDKLNLFLEKVSDDLLMISAA